MSKEQPLPKRMRTFVCFHLYDRHAFAPFTGQDFSAWHAFLYAVELYGRGDATGQRSALVAMQACLCAAQQKADVLACFKKAIPGVLDWSFESMLWRLVAPDAGHGETVWPCLDGERLCSHLKSKPLANRPGWFRCKDALCKATWKPSEAA